MEKHKTAKEKRISSSEICCALSNLLPSNPSIKGPKLPKLRQVVIQPGETIEIVVKSRVGKISSIVSHTGIKTVILNKYESRTMPKHEYKNEFLFS